MSQASAFALINSRSSNAHDGGVAGVWISIGASRPYASAPYAIRTSRSHIERGCHVFIEIPPHLPVSLPGLGVADQCDLPAGDDLFHRGAGEGVGHAGAIG